MAEAPDTIDKPNHPLPGALGRLLDRFIDNLHSYVAGEPLAGVVDRVAGY